MPVSIFSKWLWIFLSFYIFISCKNKDQDADRHETIGIKLDTGPRVDVMDQLIPAAGGSIDITDSTNVLNGFRLHIPGNSYEGDQPFKIAYSEIRDKELKPGVKIITPLIHVDNGGGYSKDIMTISIPIGAYTAEQCMVFHLDEETGELDALPSVMTTPGYIAVVTRHFSPVFATAFLDEDIYLQNFDSGFKPGVDDWQMGNPSVHLAEGGQCSGESASMLWYYIEKKLKNKSVPSLNGLYDGDGREKTPDFWSDDVNPLKMCGILQYRYFLDAFAPGDNAIDAYQDLRFGKSDEETMKEFAKAFRGGDKIRPQFIAVRGDKGSHAMVVYGMDNGTLFIADPNAPGSKVVDGKKIGMNRKIVYDHATKKFKPYTSIKSQFTKFAFMGQWALVSKKSIEELWPALETGNFDPKYYPKYRLEVMKAPGEFVPLGSSHTTGQDGVFVPNAVPANNTTDEKLMAFAIYPNYQLVGYEPLAPGKYKMGIMIAYNKQWAGFEYVDLEVPERRTTLERPYDYTGKDCFMEVYVGGKKIEMDSIRLLVSFSEKKMLWQAFQLVGGRKYGSWIQFYNNDGNFDGPGVFQNSTISFSQDEDDPLSPFFETANGTIKVVQWSEGVLMGSFEGMLKELGGENTTTIKGTFRYPK